MKSHQGSGGKNRPKAKRAVYDSLSRNFFNDRENAADFYNATHEGSPRISAEDAEIATLDTRSAMIVLLLSEISKTEQVYRNSE